MAQLHKSYSSIYRFFNSRGKMKLTKALLTLLVVTLLLGSMAMSVTAAGGPHPRQVISNPFHEYSGIPGLKLGYGDVLAQCQSYDNVNNV